MLLRSLLSVTIVVHGLIHLMGFIAAFGNAGIFPVSRPVPKLSGMFWLLAGLSLLTAAILLLMKKNAWWMVVMASVALSQAMIASAWAEARYGSFVNALLVLVAALSFTGWLFKRRYTHDVRESFAKTGNDQRLITEADLAGLPPPVQRYLRYTGVIGRPRVESYRITFEGQMRDKGKPWFTFSSEQYNFTHVPTRLFFMKASMFGLEVPGYHRYRNGEAGMHIKLFGVIPLVDKVGGVLDNAETVTIFNDMCLFAPGSLVNDAITWEPIDGNAAKATYAVNGRTISATLYFNDRGELTDFVSDDRYAVADMKRYRFSTPVGDYKNFNGYRLASYGEATWHYPDGPFVYGRFHTSNVELNPSIR